MRLRVLGMTMLTASPATAAQLTFERAFATAGEPAGLHYRVAYRASGGVHRLEVWRDGDRRIRRDTDAALTTVAVHAPGETGYRLSVLDRVKHVHTVIDRTNLYRIGAFTDWFDLGHGLRHPRGAYRLSVGKRPRATPAPLRPCAWYELSERARATRVCWDGTGRLPMLIVANDGRLIWRVTALERKRIPARVFAIDDKGYVRDDANRDIESD